MTHFSTAVISASVTLVFAASAAFAQDTFQSFIKGDLAVLTTSPNRPEPTTPFLDANGRSIALADLKANGKIWW